MSSGLVPALSLLLLLVISSPSPGVDSSPPFCSLLIISPLPICIYKQPHLHRGFPDSSVGKEFICNAGDPSSIPGLGRSPGEGIGYPLQYWASLVAQLVKSPAAMWETWVRSLDSSPGEGKGYPFQYSGLENSMDCTVHGVAQSWTPLSDFHFHSSFICIECLSDGFWVMGTICATTQPSGICISFYSCSG